MTHRRSSSSQISRKGRRKTKTEKKHNKWFQRGCQNKSARKGGQKGQKGGRGILGGNAWAPSDIHPVSGAEGPAAAAAPGAATATAAAGHSQKGGNSGNHYVFNPNPLSPPQASNALVEMANKMAGVGGSGKRRHLKQRVSRKSRKGIKLACSRSRRSSRSSSRRSSSRSRQHGGATEYLPMTASNIIRSMGDDVGSFIHGLQGAPTAYNYSDPTIQPIGNTSQLQ